MQKLQKFQTLYRTGYFIRCLGIAIQLFACITDLSLARAADSIAIRIWYIVMAIFFGWLCWRTMQELGNFRRKMRYFRVILEVGEPVETNHGDTIGEVMLQICTEPVEYVAFFRDDGSKLCESTLNHPTMVMMTPEGQKLLLQNRGAVMIRNHPGVEPVAFSPEDLTYLTNGLCRRSIVVTPSLCFMMEAPKGFQTNPRVLHKLARRFYRGSSTFEASMNFCYEVSERLGWQFAVIVTLFAFREPEFASESKKN